MAGDARLNQARCRGDPYRRARAYATVMQIVAPCCVENSLHRVKARPCQRSERPSPAGLEGKLARGNRRDHVLGWVRGSRIAIPRLAANIRARPACTRRQATPDRNQCSGEPVARSRPAAPDAIGRICERASVDRKATTSDASREASSEAPKLGDPLVDPSGPVARETRPILSGGSAIGRKLGELSGDLPKGQSDPLREDDKGDPAQRRSGEVSMA
jgi:hypothetical protein